MARLRKYGFAFAAAGALALCAGITPMAALAQSADPLENPRVRDDADVFADREIELRGLRGRLDPEQDRDRRNPRRAGQDAAGQDPAAVLFREPPDPLRDPLADFDPDAVQTEPRAGSVQEAEEEPYAALGVQFGSFLLFPELSVESLYDGNLFLSSNNKDGDWALVVRPSLRVQSTWSRHSLTGTVSSVRSYHDRFSGEDDETYSAGLTGRLDIRRTTNLVAGVDISQSLEDRSSSDFPAGAAGRAATRNKNLSLEGNHGFNRVTLTLRGELAKEDFDDGTSTGGGAINNDDRDFTERRVTARAAYEFRPGVAAFAEASVNKRVFVERFDDDGTRNGSYGQDVQGGLSFELTGKLTGEISAGYAFQSPDDITLSDVNGLIFNAGLEWRASGLTAFRLDATSEIDETTQTGSAGSIVRRAAISVEHRPRRHITVGASLGFEEEKFAGTGEVDEEIELALTGEYNFTRGAALTADYSYLKSTSSTPDSDYSVNEFRLGMRLRR